MQAEGVGQAGRARILYAGVAGAMRHGICGAQQRQGKKVSLPAAAQPAQPSRLRRVTAAAYPPTWEDGLPCEQLC